MVAVKYNQIALKIQTKKIPMSVISNGSVSMRIRIIVARPNRILGLNKPYYVRLKTNPPGVLLFPIRREPPPEYASMK